MGKVSHQSRSKAQAMLRSLTEKDPNYSGREFWCGHCNGWHVGRLKTRTRANKKSERRNNV
jgi:hypothetical protein